MLAREKTVVDDVLSLLREFDTLATMLQMPQAERQGILNLSPGAFAVLSSGAADSGGLASPELIRRLNYALPLMRRMVANASVLRLPMEHPGLRRKPAQTAR